MTDISPKKIFKCIESYTHFGTFGKTKHHMLQFKKDRQYYYTEANGIVFIHDVEQPLEGLPWLKKEEFDILVGNYLVDTQQIPITDNNIKIPETVN